MRDNTITGYIYSIVTVICIGLDRHFSTCLDELMLSHVFAIAFVEDCVPAWFQQHDKLNTITNHISGKLTGIFVHCDRAFSGGWINIVVTACTVYNRTWVRMRTRNNSQNTNPVIGHTFCIIIDSIIY